MTNKAATYLKDIIDSVDYMVEKIQAIAASALSKEVENGINNVVQLSTAVTSKTEIKTKELLAMVSK